MNGVVNQNQLTFVKEYEFDNPLIQKIDSLIDSSIRDSHHKCFHTFEYECVYDLNFTNDTNNESINFTISDKNLGMYELNKKLSIARQRGFIFNQINKLTKKIYSNLSNINIHYYLKLQIPITHRRFFMKLAYNRDYIETHWNDLHNPIHFGCRRWYAYNNTGTHIF